ncbi:MAG: diacylglycerol kinase family lipid kinase [Coriobacteriia bacterium]|nr:diacylglycerol kinase family lipid kinase [Coriobacteriia bacterium]
MSSLGKSLAVVNPAARHGVTGRMLPAIRELLDGVVDYDLVVSDAPRHALDLARESTGYDSVIAVGGDGTVHEILNGLMARPADDRPALALIPTGSGNDYRRTLGVSPDLPTAVRQIASGVRKQVDVGVANGAYFANSMGIGLDARVTAKAVETKVRTGWSGLPLYLRALFFVLFRQFYSHPVRIQFDDEPAVDLDMLLIAMTNGPTYGGGFFITPRAISDDGLLDVCYLDRLSLPGALWRLPFLVLGKHENMRPVHTSRHARVRLWSEKPVEGQIDGEVLLDSHYDVQVLPKALEVVVPGGE